MNCIGLMALYCFFRRAKKIVCACVCFEGEGDIITITVYKSCGVCSDQRVSAKLFSALLPHGKLSSDLNFTFYYPGMFFFKTSLFNFGSSFLDFFSFFRLSGFLVLHRSFASVLKFVLKSFMY